MRRAKEAVTLAFVTLTLLVTAGCSPGPDTAPRTELPMGKPQGTALKEENAPPPLGGGICNRRKTVQQAILQELGVAHCRSAGPEDLREIRTMLVDSRSIDGKDLEGLENLLQLEITGLAIPLERTP